MRCTAAACTHATACPLPTLIWVLHCPSVRLHPTILCALHELPAASDRSRQVPDIHDTARSVALIARARCHSTRRSPAHPSDPLLTRLHYVHRSSSISARPTSIATLTSSSISPVRGFQPSNSVRAAQIWYECSPSRASDPCPTHVLIARRRSIHSPTALRTGAENRSRGEARRGARVHGAAAGAAVPAPLMVGPQSYVWARFYSTGLASNGPPVHGRSHMGFRTGFST